MKRVLFVTLIVLTTSLIAFGRVNAPNAKAKPEEKTLAERLGYARDAKLVIVHADDLGMAHSVNAASIKAMETGLVNSASIMVPCPWFLEIAQYAQKNPEADLGLHLTLTSEWDYYRWGPVLSRDKVATLFDKNGYLFPTETEAAANINTREVEAEIRAQIERARAFGIKPTHLDSHMRTLYQNKALFEALLKVARDYKLPVMLSKEWLASIDYLASILEPSDVVIDNVITIGPAVTPDRWTEFYTSVIKNIKPGVTELVIHLAYDDEEMKAATNNRPNWGSGWRQRDFNFFTSEEFRRLLKENNIKLITWREIGKLIAKT